MEAAYNSSPIARSENSHTPTLSLEVRQQRTPKQSLTKMELAETILQLCQMGMIAEYVGEEEKGPPRFRPVEGVSL